MSFDNLKRIHQFTEHSHEENYWKSIFNLSDNEWYLSNYTSIQNNSNFPPCDLYLMKETYYIEFELPGIVLKNINIKLTDNILQLSGNYSSFYEECSYYLKERQNRHFLKKIILPYHVAEEDMNYRFSNGLLTLRFPFE